MVNNKESKIKKKSLKNELLKSFLAAGIIPLLIFAAISALIIRTSMYKSEVASLKQISSMATENLDKWGENNILLVEEMADSQIVKSRDAAAIQTELKMKKLQNTEIENIMYVDLNGNVIADSVGSKGVNIKNEAYFEKASGGYTYVSDVILDETSKSANIMFSAPVKDDNANYGYIISKIKTSGIETSIGNNFFAQGGNIFTFNSDGNITYHENFDKVMKENIITGKSKQLSSGAKKALDGNFNNINYTYDGEKGVAVYNYIPSLNWGTMTTVKNAEIYAGFKSVFITSVPLFIILVVLINVLAVYIIRKFIRPISELGELTKKVAKGDLLVRCNLNEYDEIEKIGNDFNEMVAALKSLVVSIYDKSDTLKNESENLNGLAGSAHTNSMDISRAMDEVANGAVDQASRTEDTLVQVKNLEDKMNEMLYQLQEVNNALSVSQTALNNGNKGVNELKDSTEVQSKLIVQASVGVNELSQSVANIDTIISTISEIAEQTNLLALNASIEAARAGEAGKGFAVVAEEVGKLANESQNATHEIAEVLGNIRRKATATTELMTSIDKSMHVQASTVNETINIFSEIECSDKKIGENIKSFTTLTDYINKFSAELLNLIETLASTSEESAAVAEEVTASADDQIAVVEKVKLSGDEILNIVGELEENIEKFTI